MAADRASRLRHPADYGAQPGYQRPTRLSEPACLPDANRLRDPAGVQQRWATRRRYSPTPTNTMRAALVLAFLFPRPGWIVGLIARSQLKRSNEQGDGLAYRGSS